MSTFERPALSVVSASSLNKKTNSDSNSSKPTLPNIKSLVSSKSFSYPAPSAFTTSSSIQKPTTRYTKHAEKLKYRLKLAYYKLRTDQVSLPIAEIIKKQESKLESQNETIDEIEPPQQTRKPAVTPSLTRHISLLAASTPLQSQPITSQKKKVSFQKTLKNSSSSSSSSSSTKPSVSKTSSAALSRISEYQRPEAFRSLSSPQLGKSASFSSGQHRSLKIEDLVNNTNQSRVDITPVKGRTDENGDLIMSSPTKKLFSSTPGSYGAAKSLLQLSLISSN